MKSIMVPVIIFALWIGLILGCSSADNSNSSKPSPTTTPTAKAASTPAPAPQSTPTPEIDGKITRQELGKDWAFTVDEGVLACDGKNGVGVVTFTTGGKTYVVNGIGKGGSKYEPVDPIWAEDPSIKGVKKDIGAIVQRGLKLCK